MLFGHECYMSHDTRTIFCKKLVWLAYKAQERMKRRLQGEKEAEAEDEEANLFEPEWMDDDGEALQESDVEDGAVMVAVPLKGKGAADESMVSDGAQKQKRKSRLEGLPTSSRSRLVLSLDSRYRPRAANPLTGCIEASGSH